MNYALIISDAAWVSIGIAVPATIASIATLIVSLRSSKKQDTMADTQNVIHTNTNSLVKKLEDQAEAQGRADVHAGNGGSARIKKMAKQKPKKRTLK